MSDREDRPGASASAVVTAVVAVVVVLMILGLLICGGLALFVFSVRVGEPVQTITPPAVQVTHSHEEVVLPEPTPVDEGPLPPGSRDVEAKHPPDPPKPPSDTSSGAPDDAQSTSAGPRDKYLATLEPVEVADVRLDEQPLRRLVTSGGREHRECIWAQPREDRGTCQVSYLLDKRYLRLQGAAGLADVPAGEAPAENPPAVAFRIYGDGNLLWQSQALSAPGAAQAFDVDVSGVQLVVLVSESDGPSNSSRGVWMDARVVPAAEGP